MSGRGGVVTDRYGYDAWGNLTTHTTYTDSVDQPFQYVGQLGYYTHYQDPKLDPESNDPAKYVTLQLGVRYYAPELGRSTERDPD